MKFNSIINLLIAVLVVGLVVYLTSKYIPTKVEEQEPTVVVEIDTITIEKNIITIDTVYVPVYQFNSIHISERCFLFHSSHD